MRKEHAISEQMKVLRSLPGNMMGRVEMSFFTSDDGSISPLVAEPGDEFEVDAVFVCRSGAWVPPWLDQCFIDFVREGQRIMNTNPMEPFSDDDMSPMVARTDFDYDEAVKLGEMWRLGQKELLEKQRQASRRDLELQGVPVRHDDDED
jgi:hypothetical protein